ncbi:MAG TPA: hypothetical protein VGD67_13955 [Pseudonocardiaceae bacterium]
MQTLLAATVVVLTVLVLIDLALTLAIIRRLRETADGHGHGHDPAGLPTEGPPPGTPVPAGLLETVAGPPVDLAEVTAGRGLLAFVANGCTPCHEQLPELRERVAEALGRGDRAVVVMLDPDGTDHEIAAMFAGLVPVVRENGEAAVSAGLGVGAYPCYLECAGSQVLRTHLRVGTVPAGSRV